VSGGTRQLRVQVLGPVSAWLAGQPLDLGPARQRALLAVLAFRPGKPVSRDEIIDAVWGDNPPHSAVNGVHTYVKGLRRALEPGRPHRSGGEILSSVAGGYALRLEPMYLDARAFEVLIERAAKLRADADLAAAARSLDEALGVWQGTPLSGVGGRWAEAERTRLSELRLTATEQREDLMLAAGRHSESAAELVKLVRKYPLRERFRAQLMIALYRCGRQADALAVFADTRQVLVAELGVEPGPDLQQVHQQILRGDPAIGGPQQAAHSAHTRRDRLIPRQLPALGCHFVGRSAELGELGGLMNTAEAAGGKTVVISAIGGMPGVGKTALAVHWARQVAHRFPDGQLYVNLRGFDPHGTPLEPSQALRGFLDAFAVPATAVPVSLDAQAALFRTLVAGQRLLIVLDNAHDEDQVRPLLPSGPNCLVIVTSRNLLTGLVAAEGAAPMTLDVLTRDEAHDLLARRLGSGRVSAEAGAAARLAALCGRLPLALSLAAARLATHPGLAIDVVAGELADAESRLDTLTVDDVSVSVRAVFARSCQELTPPAARIFRLLGLHPGPDITVAAAASLAGVPIPEARASLTELLRLHLATEPVPGRFTLHDLLRAFAAETAGTDGSTTATRAAVHRMLDHYTHTARNAGLLLNPRRDAINLPPPQDGVVPDEVTDDQRALAWFKAEHRVLVRALTLAAERGFDAHAWRMAWGMADFLGRQGHWHDWIATQQTALASASRLGDETVRAHVHLSLGGALLQLGSPGEAGPHLSQALTLCRRLGDDTGYAAAHSDLAHLHELQGDHRTAVEHAEQALLAYRDLGHQPGQARALNNLGWFQALAGDHQQALSNCEQALSLHQALGNGFGQAATLDSLGYIHHQAGEPAQAIICYRRAVELYDELGERYQAADALAHLGDACLEAGDRAASQAAWESALATLDDLEHPAAESVRAKLSQLVQRPR